MTPSELPQRSEVIMRMRQAYREGQSASAFISEMREQGLSYRRTTMLADWRSVNQVEAKKGLMRYVRKDRLPTPRVVADVEWNLSAEYMYNVRVRSVLEPGQPAEERFVNIMSDRPLTPREVEEQVYVSWGEWYEDKAGEITEVVPEAVQRVVS